MKTPKEPLTLLGLLGGTIAVLEGVQLLIHTSPEIVALAAVAWLLLRDRDYIDM